MAVFWPPPAEDGGATRPAPLANTTSCLRQCTKLLWPGRRSYADTQGKRRGRSPAVPVQRHCKAHPLRWLQKIALLIQATVRHILTRRHCTIYACSEEYWRVYR